MAGHYDSARRVGMLPVKRRRSILPARPLRTRLLRSNSEDSVMKHFVGRWVIAVFVVAMIQLQAAPTISWTNNLLKFRDPRLPGGQLEIWYLEAFLGPGASQQEWAKSTLRHRTELVSATADGRELHFRTLVEPALEVFHVVQARADGLDFSFELSNRGTEASTVQWFQPACIRLAAFTGRGQGDYISRSFIYTAAGLTTLDRLHRTTNALYLGGQVCLPPWTQSANANPRPIAGDTLANGLIGCFSADNQWLLATASDRTHELFEGVYVCLHSDPLIGGLKPGETKKLRQKIYLLPNNPKALLRRYHRDFPPRKDGSF